MWKKTFHAYSSLLIQVLVSGFFILFFTFKVNAKAEAVLYSMKPPILKQYPFSQRSGLLLRYLDSDFLSKNKNHIYAGPASISGDDILKIEVSDAIDGIKYSQPDVAYSLFNLNPGLKVPSSTFLKDKHSQAPAQNPSSASYQKESFPVSHISEKDTLNPIRDMHPLNSFASEEASSDITGGESNGNSENKNFENIFETYNHNDKNINLYQHTKKNFTNANTNLMSVSSDAVLSYDTSIAEFNDNTTKNSSLKLDSVEISDVPTQVYSLRPESKILLPELTTPSSVLLNTLVYIDYVNSTNVTTDLISTSTVPHTISAENVTNTLPSTDSEKKLSSTTVAGIVITVLICVTLLSSAAIYLLYRKFNGKCTGVVESKFNSDNCGYLDDSLHSSIYLNNHIELPKESSEEMTSLDNDSFLNSLETMTIQNYWADNSKNTKV